MGNMLIYSPMGGRGWSDLVNGELKQTYGGEKMYIKPKRFRCDNCKNETYTDSDECIKCLEKDTIKPIPKDHYKCYLNGNFYGGGDLNYMHELFKDYVITCKMYGKKECDFKIIKD